MVSRGTGWWVNARTDFRELIASMTSTLTGLSLSIAMPLNSAMLRRGWLPQADTSRGTRRVGLVPVARTSPPGAPGCQLLP